MKRQALQGAPSQYIRRIRHDRRGRRGRSSLTSRTSPTGLAARTALTALAGAFCLVGLAGLVGCGGLEPPPRPNVIVLLVDTLRAQDLGAYGYDRPTSPHLDALAEKSFLFEQARAQAPCTFPSVNSILTGLPPSRFAGQPDGHMGIPDGIATLPAILRAHGYATAAVSASPIVRATPSNFNPHGGFEPGFEHFDESCLWRTATCVRDQAFEQIDALPRPFFLYLHFMDPHGPYRPRKEWPRQFAVEPYDGPEAVQKGNPNPIAKRIAAGEVFPQGSPERAHIAHFHDLYDDEIAFFDDALGKFLDGLTDRGLLDNTVVVLLADHGEAFYEHGQIKHCHTVYDNEVHVPLLIRLPRAIEATGPRRVAAPAASFDLTPTLLDYLQIEPPETLPGTSLRSAIEGRGAASGEEGDGKNGEGGPRIVVSEWAGARAASDGRFKLILRARAGRPELYDLASDPGETRNLIRDPRHRQTARRLGREISRWVRQEAAAARERGEESRWSDRVMDRLRSLGYVQ